VPQDQEFRCLARIWPQSQDLAPGPGISVKTQELAVWPGSGGVRNSQEIPYRPLIRTFFDQITGHGLYTKYKRGVVLPSISLFFTRHLPKGSDLGTYTWNTEKNIHPGRPGIFHFFCTFLPRSSLPLPQNPGNPGKSGKSRKKWSWSTFWLRSWKYGGFLRIPRN